MSVSDVPPPDESSSQPPPWLGDSKAKAEVAKWGDDDALRGQRAENDLRWLKVYGYLVPALMCIFTVIYLSALVSWVLHYVTPWAWLNEGQLGKIQSMIFSGSVGAFIASVIVKHAQR